MNRGNAYKAKGDLNRALRDYDEAITLNPKEAGAYVDRALVLTLKGGRNAAMKDYDEAIRLNPKQWEAYFNRAANLREEGESTKAITDLTEVTKLNPKFNGAYVNRAAAYIAQGELDKAISDCNTATELNPNDSEAYVIRANAYTRKKDYAKALSDLEAAVRLKPKKVGVALNSLAWFRATCPEAKMRDGKEAVELATKACDLLQWKNASVIDTLAAACAEVGDFDQAIRYESNVLSMSGVANDTHADMQKRLDLYKQRKPYREQ
jgi:tetratricopeptide (TPR) repeat protein